MANPELHKVYKLTYTVRHWLSKDKMGDESKTPRTNTVARLFGVLLFAALTLVCFRFDLTIGIAVFGVLTIVVLVGR